ncbi:MAG TPA: LamG-like jellyroll fold domain-containing protein, partial [Herpetosiphonaceae bacterium]|nr:LamG-like jellyroll fold domain-containing protein [Herpetosiphonaceae bacterium]
PGGDPLGFLAGASNVRAAGSETRQFGDDEAGLTFSHTRYTFDFDGAAFIDRLGERLADQMRQRGQLLPGMQVNTDAYREMSGQGELWIDSDGLPRRLALRLDLPRQKNGGQASAEVTIDYLAFDRARLAVASTGLLENPGAWIGYRLSTHAAALRRFGLVSAGFLAALLLIVAIARRLGRRRAYALTVTAVLISMLTVPQVQAANVSTFFDQQEQQQAAADEDGARAERAEAAQASLTADTWDPHAGPQSSAALENAPPAPTDPAAPFALHAPSASAADSDGDGLSDDEEEYWGSCPSASSTSEFCEDVADSTDSDADGLGDGAEVQDLATLPNQWDSDGDGISDTLEVKGFTYKSQTWYLDAYGDDTNKDGLIDGVECEVWVASSDLFNPAAVCPDTDGDGTPNAFDDDNDGDRVPDNADTSPNAALSSTFSDNNPLQLSISNLTLNKPVYVDIQLRTTDASHLSYQGTVLNWPAGDTDGQIMRNLDTTFANPANAALASSDANAANGDVRMVPMLEVTVPHLAGHYGNLPVTDTYKTQGRPAGLAVDSWVDGAMLQAYGINVNDTGASATDLVYYAPLNPVSDNNGDGRVALGSRLYYEPTVGGNGIATWGNAHQVRLVWMIQMITDSCTDPANTATCTESLSLVHVYDDTWKVTGINVSEQHGVDVAIVYEDPAQDSDLSRDSELWSASWNLNNTFVSGRDCDSMNGEDCVSNGERDVTVANLASSISGWAGGQANTALEVSEVFSYPDEAHISEVMSEETPAILNEIFADYADETVPTLMFAQENTTRGINLDGVANLGASQPALSLAGAVTGTSASLSWSPYQYVGGDWQNYDADEYLTYLETQLSSDLFFTDDDSQDGIDEILGKLIWANAYYITLLTGVAEQVEADGVPTWYQNRVIDQSIVEPSWPASTTYGFTYLGFSFLFSLKALSPALAAEGSTFWGAVSQAFSQEFGVYSFQFSKLFQTGWIKTSMNVALGVATVLVAVGAVLLAVGTLTGNSAMLEIAIYMLNACTIVVVGLFLANLLYTSGLALTTAVATHLSKFKAVGPVGLVLGVLVAWGMFFYQWDTMNLSPGSAAFNLAFTKALAASLLILFFFILETFFPVVGAAIVMIIFLIDAILALLGETGIQEWLSAKIAEAIYDVDFVVQNMDSSDRLSFNVDNIWLRDSEAGFIESNAIYYSLDITNTIRYKTSEFSQSEARSASFRYDLKTNSRPIYTVEVGEMEDEWVPAGSGNLRVTDSQTLDRPIEFRGVRTGVNRSLNGTLYLVEEFQLPYEGCWKALYWEVECEWFSYHDYSPINLGQYQSFDILPDTIGSFAGMGWNKSASLPFPTQKDLDGDGLLAKSQGGSDPNDGQRDSDGDGIDDPGEQALGTNAALADSDGDGLGDREEIAYGTDELAADSDGDGFSDYFEIRQGWSVGYLTTGGALLQTRVWPDPLSSDGDNDGIADMAEYRYGFNPRATNDMAELDTAVEFGSVEVNETIVPRLLLRFEESQGAQAFADSSGVSDSVTCDATCPAAGSAGRYGSALSLDGGDYLPANSGVTELARGDFTMAAWVKTTGTSMGIVTKSDGDGAWESGERSFYIDSSGKPTFVGFGNNYIAPYFAVNDGQWHHVAVTWKLGDNNGGTAAMYIDGVNQTHSFNTNYGAGNADKAGDILYVGRGNSNSGEAASNFNGALDEVAVFDRALSAADIAMLKDGRYNANDLLVAPGAGLTYQAVISNTNSTLGVNGHLSGATSGSDPAIGQPFAALRMEKSDRVTTFTNATGESSTATCGGDSCPAGVSSRNAGAGNAVQFGSGSNNNDDYVSLPSIVTGNTSNVNYTVAFWIKLNSKPANGGLDYIFQTDSEADGALSMYVHPDLSIGIFVEGRNSHYSTAKLAVGAWTHLLVTTTSDKTRLYINGAFDSEEDHFNVSSFIVGPGRIGNDMAGTSPIQATLDDFVVYSNKTASATVATTIYNDTYFINTSAIGFYYPTLLLQFNDTGSVAFANRMNDSAAAACASATTCPTASTTGAFGGAAFVFDGTDDYLTLSNADFARGDYTIGAWFKTSASGAEQSILGATQAGTGNHGIYLSLQSNGTLRFLHRFPFGASGGASVTSSQAYNNGAWHYATAVRKGSTLTLYVDGASVGTGTASSALDKSLDVAIGRLSPTSAQRYFNGALDEILIVPAAVDSEGAAALMESAAPFIDIADDFASFSVGALGTATVSGDATVSSNIANSEHLFTEEVEAALAVNQTAPIVDANSASLAVYMPFEDIPGATSFSNLVNSSRDAVCSGGSCPDAGLRTQIDRGLAFDGVEDRLRAEDTATTFNADSIAAWVKADRGTIVDLRSGNGLMGVQLDTNAFQLTVYDNNAYVYYSVPVNLTKNTWTHVAATFNRTSRVATVYINGAQSATLTIPAWSAGGSFSGFKYPSIGADIDGGDYLHGYLDDLRIYKDLTLTAAQVQSLYSSSAPLMRFEFDESAGAATFADKGPSAYAGQPVASRCASVSIDSLTATVLAASPSALYVAQGANRLATVPAATVGATTVITSSSLICEGESLQVGLVAADGGTTPIASQLVGVTTPGAASAVFASGSNSVTLNWTVEADTIYSYNPAPGADGKLGNGAVFNGSGAITVAGASTVNALTSAFTVMSWVKPEDITSNTPQVLLSAGAQNSANGFGFGVAQKKLWFSNLTSTVYSGDVLSGSAWQHVAVVYDSAGQTVKFYVDGTLKSTVSGAAVPAVSANADDNLYIGARSGGGGALGAHLSGELDELAVYGRSLSAAEVSSIYSREVIWYRVTSATTVRVDSDLPQIELLSDYDYRALAAFQLSASAVDVSSGVTIFDVGVEAPNGSTSWSSAPVCQEAQAINSSAAWCPTVDPTATGEGAYDITLRAVDLAGNQVSSAPARIYVDGTAPQATSPYNLRQRPVTEDPDADLTWSVNLAGTISDPALSDGSPASGLVTTTVMVRLIDELGDPVADGAQLATINGSAWSIDYQMTGRHPVGYYDIEITAEDAVGNRSASTVGSLMLDTYAPTVDVDRDTLPADVISQTTVFTGSMIDVPEPGGAVAKYHFEPGLGLLEDSSGNDIDGSCTSCPTTSEGLFGTTLTFNKNQSQFVTTPATTTFNLASYTASVWVRPTWAAGTMGYSPAIMGIRSPAGAVFGLSLRDNYSRLEIYTGASPMPSRAPAVSIAQN